MSIELSQDHRGGVFYMRLWGDEYWELTKEIRRLGKKINRATGKNQKRVDELNLIRAQLIKKRRRAEQYVRVALQDIPEGVNIRPIYWLTGRVVGVSPAEHAALLQKMRALKPEPEGRDAI